MMLTPAELFNLREFVKNVLTLVDSDEDGLLVDLYGPALTAAEILGSPVTVRADSEEGV